MIPVPPNKYEEVEQPYLEAVLQSITRLVALTLTVICPVRCPRKNRG